MALESSQVNGSVGELVEKIVTRALGRAVQIGGDLNKIIRPEIAGHLQLEFSTRQRGGAQGGSRQRIDFHLKILRRA